MLGDRRSALLSAIYKQILYKLGDGASLLAQRERIHLQCGSCRRPGFDPWVRKIPWRRKWLPTPVFFLENPMDSGAWQAIAHGIAKSQT